MTLIREVAEQERPLCPNVTVVGPAAHPMHAIVNTVLDAFHEAADTDADGEFTSPEVARAYQAADAAASARMWLYVDRAGWSVPGVKGRSTVEAWYFRCPVCGLTMPANPVRRP